MYTGVPGATGSSIRIVIPVVLPQRWHFFSRWALYHPSAFQPLRQEGGVGVSSVVYGVRKVHGGGRERGASEMAVSTLVSDEIHYFQEEGG